MAEALKPFHNPKLRGTILRVKAAAEQVIDEVNATRSSAPASTRPRWRRPAPSSPNFRQFIEDHKDEIEAIRILYSRPYRAGLRYRQVKELALKLGIAPFYVDAKKPETVGRLWQAFEAVEPREGARARAASNWST